MKKQFIFDYNYRFMNLNAVVIFFAISSICACKNQSRPIPQNEPPAALQEKSELGISFSKRGGTDLVESLYAEIMDKTPELKTLEKSIAALQDEKADSLASGEKYFSNNTTYYHNADNYINQISDSILKEKIRTLIKKSMAGYEETTIRYINLQKLLDAKSVNLNDLHIVLKLVKTLPVMEKYQKDNLPSTKPLERVNGKFDKTIDQLNTLTKDKY